MNSGIPQDQEQIGKRVGLKLRQIRSTKGLSMEGLANQIGVSKLTLGKIERGEANPTLSVLWKIASGLSVPLTSLFYLESEVQISRKKDSIQLNSPDKVFIVEHMFNNNAQSFELYRGYLKPFSEYESEAHSTGVVEYVTVMSGALNLEVNGATYVLQKHDSICFNADSLHKYINSGSELAELHFTISYQNIT
ncbi:helix-turn-helix domain-containing protein [Chengkuizengella axinellae]|uniref:XRE family transcriptional regulator n=1 Tax=Chengkuizengella axinellae TaxID=3064388 RepID=A0ABT9IW86_9BACL|nr:XRE family transcriptional regulator [Chengkuizengella sp. 2205SS18-9]MDP5273634.1 XRE family transcriptional regulator [Chengkuizengella sp. 2205SS18-9]